MCGIIDLEELRGEVLVKDRLLCVLSDMMERASAEAIDEAEEPGLLCGDKFLRVESKDVRVPLLFFFSRVAASGKAEVCERKKVATLCGIL